MRSMRHVSPLIDVRRPRRGEKVGINPPGFVWQPIDGVRRYRLQAARDRTFAGEGLLDFPAAERTLFVPPQPLAAGRWYWRWRADEPEGKWSQVFPLEVLPDAAEMRFRSPEELCAALGEHPRAMVPRPGGVEALRAQWRVEKRPLLEQVRARGESLLGLPHELPEPPFLPDERSVNYNVVHVVWRKAMNDTRAFCGQTVDLAMAYLVSGDRRFAEAAACRLDSLARWDPDGSTRIEHNDEPHMAVMDGGPIAFDWVADMLDGERRERIVAHLARRAENTCRRLLDLDYGVRNFGSHEGRMIGFLGQCGLALGGHHDRAGTWLKLVLDLTAAVHPVWGNRDGGWGQGLSYCSAYVRWMLRFCFSVKTALGIDLYRKPFFSSHARWWAMCLPPYAEQTPFGDGGDGLRGVPVGNAAVITQHLGRMTGDPAVVDYGRRMAQRAESGNPDGHGVSTGTRNLIFPTLSTAPLLALPDESGSAGPGAGRRRRLPRAQAFTDVGYVAMRSHPEDADRDICLVLKSSPYGPVSHSHGDQNCFVLSAYGRPLLIRTGHYTGYSNPHHHNWVRQTKAHNGLTVSGVGQFVRNPSAVGRIVAFARKADFAYACGDAGRAYGDRLTRFHRHVLFVDYRYFLIVDDLLAPVETTFERHLHSLEPMQVDAKARRVRVAYRGAQLDAHFPACQDTRFYPSDGFDPPNDDPGFPDLPNQYHLRVATVPLSKTYRLAMLLVPNRQDAPEQFELTTIGSAGLFGVKVVHGGHADELLVAARPGPIEHRGERYEAVALWLRDGQVRHVISPQGRGG